MKYTRFFLKARTKTLKFSCIKQNKSGVRSTLVQWCIVIELGKPVSEPLGRLGKKLKIHVDKTLTFSDRNNEIFLYSTFVPGVRSTLVQWCLVIELAKPVSEPLGRPIPGVIFMASLYLLSLIFRVDAG